MALIGATVIGAVIIVLAFIISALPLHFAVKFLGGKTDVFKTAFVAFVSGIVFSGLRSALDVYGRIISIIVSFFVLIWIYREMFRLKWGKAFLAWVLQFVFLAVFYFLVALITAVVLGLSLAAIFL